MPDITDKERRDERMDGNQKKTVVANDFMKAAILILELTAPIINKERFRILIERNPESDRVTITYQFE